MPADSVTMFVTKQGEGRSGGKMVFGQRGLRTYMKSWMCADVARSNQKYVSTNTYLLKTGNGVHLKEYYN